MISYRQLLSSLVASAFMATGVAHAQNQPAPAPQPAGSGTATSSATGGLSDGAKVAIGVVVVGGIAAAIASGNKSSGTSGTTGTQ